MHIGLLRATIAIPDAHSIKEKRRVVKSLRERVSARMNISVAEVGQLELWNRADLAFVTVAGQKEVTEKRLSAIAKLLEEGRDFVLLELKTEPL
ncbi:MAG: DUF503 domain-containing protein [Candidatus Neomarinimicrobiota bacterium]